MIETENLLVFNTCPSREVAEILARTLVKKRVAACVNIIDSVVSIYEWQDELQTDNETILLIKTCAAKMPALKEILKDGHPYELPEIIAVSVADGSADYLQWLTDSLNKPVLD